MFWPTLLGYVRIATHPSVFDRPLPPEDAIANVERLLRLPHVRSPGEDERFWETFRHVSDEANVRGNLVPDAHVVALMIAHGVPAIWTHDRDYRRFRGIEVLDPFP